MRTILAPVFWLGRVLLWIVFLPLGLWRSIRHGHKKRDEKLAKMIGEETRKARDDATT